MRDKQPAGRDVKAAVKHAAYTCRHHTAEGSGAQSDNASSWRRRRVACYVVQAQPGQVGTFHACIVRQICGTGNSLSSLGENFITKLSLYATKTMQQRTAR